MMMVLTQTLKNSGYIITSASNGKEAIELINSEHPDIVITDLTLPKISGSEIVAYLKDFPGKKIRVILLSAMPQNALGNTAGDYGADAYLVKPVPPKLLLDTISQMKFLSKNPLRFYSHS